MGVSSLRVTRAAEHCHASRVTPGRLVRRSYRGAFPPTRPRINAWGREPRRRQTSHPPYAEGATPRRASHHGEMPRGFHRLRRSQSLPKMAWEAATPRGIFTPWRCGRTSSPRPIVLSASRPLACQAVSDPREASPQPQPRLLVYACLTRQRRSQEQRGSGILSAFLHADMVCDSTRVTPWEAQ
jgi:hypothetical protein